MEPTKLSETRHLDLKIEYYTLRSSASDATLDDTLMLLKYKLLRQILVVVQQVEKVNAGEYSMKDLVIFGGMDGLRKSANALKELMALVNTESDRLKVSDSDESDGVIIQFNKSMQIINDRLKKA